MALRTAKDNFKHDCRHHYDKPTNQVIDADPQATLPHKFVAGTAYDLPPILETYFDLQGWLEGSEVPPSHEPQAIQPDSTVHGQESR